MFGLTRIYLIKTYKFDVSTKKIHVAHIKETKMYPTKMIVNSTSINSLNYCLKKESLILKSDWDRICSYFLFSFSSSTIICGGECSNF